MRPLLLALGCSSSHGPPREVLVEPSDAGVEWVPGLYLCDRVESLGCSVACFVDVVCDRAKADACWEHVEAETEPGCEVLPAALEDPVCRGVCFPVEEVRP